MRKFLGVLLGLLLLISVPLIRPALAQRDLDEIFQRMRNLIVAGNYEAAFAEAQRFEGGIRARYGTQHRLYGAALNAMGVAHENLGHYSEAEGFYRRAFELPDGQQWGGFNNLAVISEKQGRYAEAEKLYKLELASAEKTPNAKDGRGINFLSGTLGSLAHLYATIGRYDEAESLYRRALAIDEKRMGKEHPDVAINVGSLASMFRVQGRLEEAERLATRALAIKERAPRRMARLDATCLTVRF